MINVKQVKLFCSRLHRKFNFSINGAIQSLNSEGTPLPYDLLLIQKPNSIIGCTVLQQRSNYYIGIINEFLNEDYTNVSTNNHQGTKKFIKKLRGRITQAVESKTPVSLF